MIEQPYLSVVIPTHRRASYLRDCLHTLHSETQKLDSSVFEIIVSDDAGDEETRSMLQTEFPQVVYTRCHGKGPGPNRNHGASQARGEWLVFIDDDCLVDAGHLAAMRKLASSGKWDVIEGSVTCPDHRDHPLYVCLDNGDGGCFWTPNLAVRKRVFEQLGGFDPDLPFNAEDMEFGHRVKTRGIPWTFAREAHVSHPARKTSLHGYYRQLKTTKALLMYAYKTGMATPLNRPDASALLQVTRAYFMRIIYSVWHTSQGKNRNRWRTDLTNSLVRLVGSPFLLPYLWVWELRYRRMLRQRQVESR